MAEITYPLLLQYQPVNQTTITWFAAVTLIVLILGFVVTKVTHPKEQIGLVLMRVSFEARTTVFLLLTSFFGIAEALTATSIVPVGEPEFAIASRFLNHILIAIGSVVSMMCASFLTKEALEERLKNKLKIAAKSTEPIRRLKSHPMAWATIGLMVIVSLFCAFTNIYLIAFAAGDAPLLINFLLLGGGLTRMNTITLVSTFVGFLHLFFTLVEAAMVYNEQRIKDFEDSLDKKKKRDEEIADKNKAEASRTPPAGEHNFENVLEWTFNRLGGNKEDEKYKKAKNAILKKMQELEGDKTDDSRKKIAGSTTNLFKLYTSLLQGDKSRTTAETDNEKLARQAKENKEIRDLFAKSVSQGGFGYTLPNF